MTKWDNIKKLQELGFNTPKYFKIKRKVEVSPLFYGAMWSVRSYQNPDKPIVAKELVLSNLAHFPLEGNYLPPHCPVLEQEQTFKFVEALISNNFVALVNEVIDPKDALFAGAGYDTGTTCTIEIAWGEPKKGVMVRKVTREGIIDDRFEIPSDTGYRKAYNVMDKNVYDVWKDIVEKSEPNHMVEFSYYTKPVGLLNQQQVYWDYYPADDKKAVY